MAGMNFLDTLRALSAKATPGPYKVISGEGDFGARWVEASALVGRGTLTKFADDPEGWADAALFAHIADHAAEIAAVVEALVIVLPMAKGYAAEHPLGNNEAMVREAIDALADLEAKQ